MASKNKLEVAVIVNGEPTHVEVNANAPLRTVIPKALEESGNAGQPPENWELRKDGVLLDPSQKIKSFGLVAGAELFLSLKAGVGGA